MARKIKNIPEFDIPSYNTLDKMSDAEYERFVNDYTEHHRTYWPNTCMMIPRQKTPEERERDEIHDKKLYQLFEDHDDLLKM